MHKDLCDWLQSKGLILDSIALDGNIHRVRRGDHHSKSAWFVGWSEPFVVAIAGDWRTGEKWEYRAERQISREQAVSVRHQIARAVAQAEREREVKRESAALRADIEFRSASSGPHPYLHKKKVLAHGSRVLGDALLIPTNDIEGKLHGLQKIYADGSKYFLTGQRFKGCFFRISGAVSYRKIYLCEGFATGASIYEATGVPVFCAFSSGNLLPVARVLRAAFPEEVRIVVAGDNDAFTTGNPGEQAAREAALRIGAAWCIPRFSSTEKLTDFNDLANSEGHQAIRQQLGEGMSHG